MKTKTQRNRNQPNVVAIKDRRNGLVRLNVPLSVKADTINTTDRTFEGLAATWSEDLGSDVIHKGAFKKSLLEWKSSTEAMPLLNSHDHFDIFAALGQALAMKETDEGLWTKWEVLDGEDGDRVLQRLRPSPRTGRAIIGKMSIGFYPVKYDYEQPEGTDSFFDRIRHINEASLKEVSLVLFPMNPGASVDASTVKMWLKAAHDTDPTTLDSLTRMELRRLNSKIGLLLKKQKPEDDDTSEDSEEEQQKPSTRKSSVTVTKTVRTTTDSDDDADDTEEDDEGIEDSDDLGTSEEDDAQEEEGGDEGDEEEPEEKPTPAKKPESKKPEEEKEQKLYDFPDALKQRLQKVTLQHKVGEAQSVKD